LELGISRVSHGISSLLEGYQPQSRGLNTTGSKINHRYQANKPLKSGSDLKGQLAQSCPTRKGQSKQDCKEDHNSEQVPVIWLHCGSVKLDLTHSLNFSGCFQKSLQSHQAVKIKLT